jgi:hypothetical protein
MKSITIGDIHLYTEDGDTWEDLIQVIRKANQTFIGKSKKPTRIEKFLRKIF